MPRRQPAEPRALVAAATRIELRDKKLAQRAAGRRQEWQEDAWAYFDLVPEIKQSTWILGNLIAKLRLFVAVENPEDPEGEPIPVSDPTSGVPAEVAAQCEAELGRLRGAVGGQAEILREMNMNLEITGEGYLIARGQRPLLDEQGKPVVDAQGVAVLDVNQPEEWSVRSISEVEVKNGETRVKDAPSASGGASGQGVLLDPDYDTAIRFWQRHPRWSGLADCAMRGVLDVCETLLILTRQTRAEARSRLPSKLLVLPSDISFGTPVPTQQEAQGGVSDNPVLDAIVEAISSAIEDESSAASLAPVTLQASGENLQQRIFTVDLSRQTDSSLEDRITHNVERLARGLNLPVEKVMGHMQTTYANANQIHQDMYEEHIDPRAILVVDILTTGFLRPQLIEAEVDPEWITGGRPVFVWFDPAQLLTQPDPAQNADAALEADAISWTAYRAAKGFTEDDAPDVMEVLLRTVLSSTRMDPAVVAAILAKAGVTLDIQALPAAPTGQAAVIDTTLADPSGTMTLAALAAMATARPASTDAGRRLMEIDRDLRTRLLVLADTAMQQALTTAGNRIRSKMPQARTLAAHVPRSHVGATMGRTLVAAAGISEDELLAGAFDALEGAFMSWGAAAQAEALDLVQKLATGFSTAERDALGLRQAEDLTEAWAWLQETLASLAHARLFDPSPLITTLGEADPALTVPAGLIRQAVTRAGGMSGVQTTGLNGGAAAWVSVTDGGSRPAGGIGTGELIMGALTSHAVQVEGYVWEVGFPAVPFEPHQALAGVTFTNFDDPALANNDSFPEFDFLMPGDHAGCQCDFTPVLLSADET